MPILGMSDDAGVLATAIAAIAAYVTETHRRQAKAWIEHEHLAPSGVGLS
jgi:uncharacterized membrane protein YkvA (DUF1232 family)